MSYAHARLICPSASKFPMPGPQCTGNPTRRWQGGQAKVDDVAPDMVSAEEPALGTHWKHGASTWSPSSLIWAAAEGNDTLEPNDNIPHSTKAQGR